MGAVNDEDYIGRCGDLSNEGGRVSRVGISCQLASFKTWAHEREREMASQQDQISTWAGSRSEFRLPQDPECQLPQCHCPSQEP